MAAAGRVTFATDCRGCDRRLTVHLAQAEAGENSHGVKVRCRECGATNHAEPAGDGSHPGGASA